MCRPLQPPVCCPVSLRIRTNYHTAANVFTAGCCRRIVDYTTQYCSCSWPKDKLAALTLQCLGLLQSYNSLNTPPLLKKVGISVVDQDRVHLAGCPVHQINTNQGLIYYLHWQQFCSQLQSLHYNYGICKKLTQLTFGCQRPFLFEYNITNIVGNTEQDVHWVVLCNLLSLQQRPSIFNDPTSHRQKLNISELLNMLGNRDFQMFGANK